MNSRYLIILINIILGFSLTACSKGPSRINFANVKNGDYINYYNYTLATKAIQENGKNYLDYFVVCDKGITQKPGIVIGVDLNDKKIGSTKVKRQIINTISGSVIHYHDYEVNPDMTSLETVYNLTAKGKYKVNYIVNDKIIAEGEIEYK